MLFTGLVAAVLSATTNGADGGNSSLAGLWGLAVLVPTLAVEVRRLRDAGFRWGHAFWGLIPFAGLIILGALNAQPSRTHVPAGGDPPRSSPLATLGWGKFTSKNLLDLAPPNALVQMQQMHTVSTTSFYPLLPNPARRLSIGPAFAGTRITVGLAASLTSIPQRSFRLQVDGCRCATSRGEFPGSLWELLRGRARSEIAGCWMSRTRNAARWPQRSDQ